MEKNRILLVDDHQMFRDALRILLERMPYIEVVGETDDAFEVIDLVSETSAQIVCMDIYMKGVYGIEAMRHLIAAYPSIKVIALSSHSDHRYVTEIMNAGAFAYVTKTESADELVRAINAALKNRKYLCQDVSTAILDLSHATPHNKLCNRERQVLKLVADGLTSAMIADRLNIATSTVDVHRRNIMCKLELHNVAELTRYAINSDIAAH